MSWVPVQIRVGSRWFVSVGKLDRFHWSEAEILSIPGVRSWGGSDLPPASKRASLSTHGGGGVRLIPDVVRVGRSSEKGFSFMVMFHVSTSLLQLWAAEAHERVGEGGAHRCWASLV